MAWIVLDFLAYSFAEIFCLFNIFSRTLTSAETNLETAYMFVSLMRKAMENQASWLWERNNPAVTTEVCSPSNPDVVVLEFSVTNNNIWKMNSILSSQK